MRDTRLAWILAALTGAAPLTAFAQTPPSGGRGGSSASSASSDDDDEDEDETPPARSGSAGGGSSATPSTPDERDTETDEARRTRVLPRYSSLDGSIGLLHASSAQLGSAGSFRFGLTGEFFSGSDFLRPTGLSGTIPSGGVDSAGHVGGTVTLSYSPLNFLEVFTSIRAYANSNDRERPSLFQVLGDTTLGVKAAGRLARGFYLGGDATVHLLNRSGDIGLMADSTSFHLRMVSTLDIREIARSVPLRLHLNFRYFFDNSAAIVGDTESARRRAQMGFDSMVCASAGAANDPRCFLEVSRIERQALGINRVDQFNINLGLEADLPYFRPFLEWSVGIPVNRQSYQCFDPGPSGMRPGGALDDDACLARESFSALPSRFTIGVRAMPPVRGLGLLAAVDIATSGSSTFVRELSPTNPWMLFFGASFAYDIHTPASTAPVEPRVETREVDRTPPGGRIVGNVRDTESRSGVGGALVNFQGQPSMHILGTGADGNFRSGRVPPGEYRLRVTAPEYNPGECTVTVPTPAPAAPAPAAPAPGAAPTTTVPTSATDTEVTVNCELRPMPRRGGLTVRVTSSQGGSGVSGAPVIVAPAAGTSGQPVSLTTDSDGTATASELLAGSYTVTVQASDRHMAAMPSTTSVVARQTSTTDVTVSRRPVRPSVNIAGNLLTVARQVHFETNQATILPDSNTLLEELADVINRHPEITSVEIQGHTDNQGAPQANQTLSDNRASSVREALTRLGVAADRVSSRGFGQTRPLRPNLTAAGRAGNRRVEFHITRAGGAAAAPAARPAAARPARPAQ